MVFCQKGTGHIAEETGVKVAKVLGAATFYTQFRFKPIGKYLVMLARAQLVMSMARKNRRSLK
jgi:NADH:ubiquinone oxidoreductase subunit E